MHQGVKKLELIKRNVRDDAWAKRQACEVPWSLTATAFDTASLTCMGSGRWMLWDVKQFSVKTGSDTSSPVWSQAGACSWLCMASHCKQPLRKPAGSPAWGQEGACSWLRSI